MPFVRRCGVSRLAILVPHLGDVASLETTLASILANRPADCEILVLLQRPYEDPYDIRGEVRFVPLECRSSVTEVVNRGIQLAGAPVVHVLLCGTEVHEGWADAALTRFCDPRIAVVAPLVLDVEDPSRIVAAGLAYHVGGASVPLEQGRAAASAGLGVKRVLAAHPVGAFYRKSAVQTLGLFDATVGDRLAGIDGGLRLAQSGWITVMDPACRVLAPRQSVPRAGAFRQAMEAERLFWRWAPTLGWARSAASHSLLVIGEAVRGLLNLSTVPRLVGRLTGGCLAAASRPCRRLEESRKRAGAEPARTRPAAARHPVRRTSPLFCAGTKEDHSASM
jgi:hypothetical protein